MLAGDFTGIKLYKLPAQDKRIKKDGTTREPKKVGKIHYPVFTPEGTRVVGFMLRLPDIAGMVKQPDRFIAYDAIGVSGDVMVAKDDRAAVSYTHLDVYKRQPGTTSPAPPSPS